MDLDDVRIFTQVVESGSFTKAAKQLSMPKSTVSRRVGQLEDRLGVLLLQRTTRSLSLTHAGEIYFSRTSRIIDEIEDAEAAVHELQTEPRGLLRVTTPGDFGGVLPGLIAGFQERYPLVNLVVFPTGRRVDLVAEGYDLALRAGSVSDSSLVSRTLLRSHLSLFASPDYLKDHDPICHPSDLSNHRCVIFGRDGVEARWRLIGPDGPLEVEVSGRLAVQDFEILRATVLGGAGVAFMPHLSGSEQLREGRLVHLLPDDPEEVPSTRERRYLQSGEPVYRGRLLKPG
jgi:DNA-binding transcriptional LysR family regulator